MINADARGYYFTEYEPAAVAALAKRTPPLTAPERISLLGDEWRIVRAGRHDIGTYLDLAAAFAPDRTPEVASEIAGRVRYIASAFPSDASQRAALRGVDAEDVPPDARCHRHRSEAGRFRRREQPEGHAAADAQLRSRMCRSARANWPRSISSNPSSLPPTLVAPILNVAAVGGDAQLYDRYLAAMKAAAAQPGAVLPLLQHAAGVHARRNCARGR